eukprot:5400103-Pyramimonas_sp.AAC.1
MLPKHMRMEQGLGRHPTSPTESPVGKSRFRIRVSDGGSERARLIPRFRITCAVYLSHKLAHLPHARAGPLI